MPEPRDFAQEMHDILEELRALTALEARLADMTAQRDRLETALRKREETRTVHCPTCTCAEVPP
jgi:hypothetical protein